MTKILFIDRDGTLIKEPEDFQIDSLEKFELLSGVIPSLISLSQAGFKFVMVTNQDALGTDKNPQDKFDMIQSLLLNILNSQGIKFEDILICPHIPEDNCLCRKPKTQMLKKYLSSNEMDRKNSYVIGDRITDVQLAENMGLGSFLLDPFEKLSENVKLYNDTKDYVTVCKDWKQISNQILNQPRTSSIHRKTKETDIKIDVSLDGYNEIQISTGIGFFDHMLEQLARHGNLNLNLKAIGDLHIDQHHMVEDVAIALGQSLKEALGDKRNIERFSFLLPMDEASTLAAIDLSGRAYLNYDVNLTSQFVGELSTEMIEHFFRSLTESLGMSLHIKTNGKNNHHMVESMFKSVGRCLGQAFKFSDSKTGIPSTKGIL